MSVFFAFLVALGAMSAAQADSVNSVSGPTTVAPNSTVTVAVGYSVSGARKIKVHFQRTSDWAWFAAGETNVSSGNGTANVSVPTGSSTNGSSYRYGAEILDGTVQTATGQQTGVTVSTSSTPTPTPAAAAPIGKTIAFKYQGNGLFVSANSGSSALIANSSSIGNDQKFQVESAPNGNIALKALVNNKYVYATNNGADPLLAAGGAIGTWEQFQWFNNSDGSFSLKYAGDPNGKYVYAFNNGAGPLQAAGTAIGTWERFIWQEVSAGSRTRKNIGTNLGIINYSTEDQSTNNPYGGNVYSQSNPNFAATSNPWNPQFLTELQPYQTIRFLDWYGGNGDSQADWNTQRTRKADGIQSGKWMEANNSDQKPSIQADGRNTWGVAVEWLVDLCNRNQSDMWINVPYRAINSDDFPNGDDFNNEYVHKLATLLKTGVDMKGVSLKNWVGGKANLSQLSGKSKQDFINAGGTDTGYSLNSGLKVYVEYSNEAWCCGRPQEKWMDVQKSKVGLNNGTYDRRWWCYAEVRCWKAFGDVFGSADMGNRIIRVAGPTHREDGRAVTFAPYFNDVYRNTAANRNPWYNSGNGVKPDAWKWASYIGGNPSNWNANVDTDANNNKSFAADMKATYGLKYFLSYEGGQHLDNDAGPFSWSNGYNAYDSYKYWLNAEAGAYDLICHYGHYGRWQSSTDPGGFGSWGAKSYIGQPDSETGKYRAMKDYVAGN